MEQSTPLREKLEIAASGVKDFKRTWRQLLLYVLAARAAVTVVIVPGLALVLRLSLGLKGRQVLSDEEILHFIVSPIGLITLVLVGGFWIGAAFIEQAGLMTICRGASEGGRINWMTALRFVGSKLPRRLLPLGSHLLGRTLIITAPFAAVGGVIHALFLRSHDINYYLTEKPPEFYWGGGLAALMLLGFVFVLGRSLLSWMFALPAVLFEDLPPAAAIARSKDWTRGHRRELLGWILSWFALSTLASVAVTWLSGLAGRLAVPFMTGSVESLAFAIGGIGLLTLISNFLISFVAAGVFAAIITRLYRLRGSSADISAIIDAEEISPAVDHGSSRRLAMWILAGAGVAVLSAMAASVVILANMRADDDVIIIAHRGASGSAPENTMASVNQAIEDEADFVEIDVQETVDGEIVVFHDSDFMKTAKNPLKIWDARLSELQTIDVGSWFDPQFADERVPTLRGVLRACKGHTKVNIELKYYGRDQDIERRVIEIVEAEGMTDDVVVMALKYDKVQKAKTLRPDWTYGLLTSVNLGDATKFNVDFLAINAAGATRSFIRRAHAGDKLIYVWTVNDPLAMSSMMSKGVDGIITDEPAEARRVLEMRAELNPIERLLIGLGAEVGVFSVPEPSS